MRRKHVVRLPGVQQREGARHMRTPLVLHPQLLCDHCVLSGIGMVQSAPSGAKLKLLHLATGSNHPGLLCRRMVDCALPFLHRGTFTPQKRGRDRWRLFPGSPIDVDAVSSDSFRVGCSSQTITSTHAAIHAVKGSPTVRCHTTACFSWLQTGTAFTHRCLHCLCQR